MPGFHFGRPEVPAELIEQLNCPDVDRELIYHGNAERLLNLKHLAVTGEILKINAESTV